MKFVILILSLWVFVRALSYGMYEIQENKNTPGGVVVISLSTIALVFVNFVVFVKGVV